MSIWTISYEFRDGSVVRRTLEASTIEEAYDDSALPDRIDDRVLDTVTVEERTCPPDVLGTSIRFGSEPRCTQPTPRTRIKEIADNVQRIVQQERIAHQDTS